MPAETERPGQREPIQRQLVPIQFVAESVFGVRRRLVALYARSQRYAEAYEEAKRVAAAVPDDAEAMQVEADLALKLKKHAEADRVIARLRSINPGQPDNTARAVVVLTRNGRGRDAGRIAEASGVRLELDAAAIPLNAEAADWRQAIADGEDYELLFTAIGDVPTGCPATGTPITRIGAVTAGRGCIVREPDGALTDASGLGWDHAPGAERRPNR